MKTNLTITALFLACILQVSAQQNCSSPLDVTLCPSTSLVGQTNLGMINDFTGACNLTGEDLVYRFTTAPAATNVYINYSALSGTIRSYLTTTCNTTSCSYTTISATTNLTYTVTGNTTYYLWIDAWSTVTYNIGFGADTSNTVINIPDTRGNWNWESAVCSIPAFNATKPFLQVKFNGVYKTNPMTMSPLNAPATLCIVNYLKNPTGDAGAKRFEFTFNPLGFSIFSPSSMSFPGFYNAGTWTATSAGNKWIFTFADLAAVGKGDFTGIPNTCLRYEFCFNVTPISNDPVKTNILDSVWNDGWGTPFNGVVRHGCCPPGFALCLGAGGPSTAAGTQGIGTAVNDPGGGGLPILLLRFNAKAKKESVDVNWITATETNNDYFTVEKSMNGSEWIPAHVTDGAGNSNKEISYSYTDPDPYPGTSYYRLKQTDYDGTTTYSDPVAVNLKKIVEPIVYPNPTNGDIMISGIDMLTNIEAEPVLNFRLSSLMGNTLSIPYSKINGEIHLDISNFVKGIYLLEIDHDGIISHHRIVLQN